MIFDDSTIQNGRFNRLKWGCWPPVIQRGHIKRIDGAWIVYWCTELKHYVVIFHSKVLVYQRHQFFFGWGLLIFACFFFWFFFFGSKRSQRLDWKLRHQQDPTRPGTAFSKRLGGFRCAAEQHGDRCPFPPESWLVQRIQISETWGHGCGWSSGNLVFFCLMQVFDIADDGYWIKWMKLILLYFTMCWSLLIFVVMIGYWFNCCSWAWWGYSVVVFSDFCDYRRCQTECSPINLYILNREPAPRLWILWSRLNIYFLVCVFSNGSC